MSFQIYYCYTYKKYKKKKKNYKHKSLENHNCNRRLSSKKQFPSMLALKNIKLPHKTYHILPTYLNILRQSQY